MLGEHPSRTENGTGYFLDTATMEWFFGHYAGHVTDVDARLSPILEQNLAGLPRPSSSPRSTTRCGTRARPTRPRCGPPGCGWSPDASTG